MANSVPSYVSHNLKIVPPHPPTINGKPTEPKQAIKMYNNEHFFATLNLNLDSKLCSAEPDWGLTISFDHPTHPPILLRDHFYFWYFMFICPHPC